MITMILLSIKINCTNNGNNIDIIIPGLYLQFHAVFRFYV